MACQITMVPLPHSFSGVVVVVWVGELVVWVCELVVDEVWVGELAVVLGVLVFPPLELMHPLATTLKTITPTSSRAINPLFMSLPPALVWV